MSQISDNAIMFGKFTAYIDIDGKRYQKCGFDSVEEALSWRKEMENVANI